jgi:hypothetical protein
MKSALVSWFPLPAQHSVGLNGCDGLAIEWFSAQMEMEQMDSAGCPRGQGIAPKAVDCRSPRPSVAVLSEARG